MFLLLFPQEILAQRPNSNFLFFFFKSERLLVCCTSPPTLPLSIPFLSPVDLSMLIFHSQKLFQSIISIINIFTYWNIWSQLVLLCKLLALLKKPLNHITLAKPVRRSMWGFFLLRCLVESDLHLALALGGQLSYAMTHGQLCSSITPGLQFPCTLWTAGSSSVDICKPWDVPTSNPPSLLMPPSHLVRSDLTKGCSLCTVSSINSLSYPADGTFTKSSQFHCRLNKDHLL